MQSLLVLLVNVCQKEAKSSSLTLVTNLTTTLHFSSLFVNSADCYFKWLRFVCAVNE